MQPLVRVRSMLRADARVPVLPRAGDDVDGPASGLVLYLTRGAGQMCCKTGCRVIEFEWGRRANPTKGREYRETQRHRTQSDSSASHTPVTTAPIKSEEVPSDQVRRSPPPGTYVRKRYIYTERAAPDPRSRPPPQTEYFAPNLSVLYPLKLYPFQL